MIYASKELVKAFSREAKKQLITLGLKKHLDDIYTIAIKEDIIGWLGLNNSTRRGNGILAVNPVVGVRHQIIECIISGIRGNIFHSYIPPSTGTNIGYLMPQKTYYTWNTASVLECPAQVNSMVEAVRQYGMPFMDAASRSNTAMLEAIQRHGIKIYSCYRIPIMLWLMDEQSKAKEFVEKQLRVVIGDRTDGAADDYRKFVGEMLKQMACHTAREYASAVLVQAGGRD